MAEVATLRRTSATGFRWQPGRETLLAVFSYVLVVAALFLAFQVFTTARVAANFITFGPLSLATLGVALPVFYTVLVRKKSLQELGLTTRFLLPSLALGLLLGWDTYRYTIVTLNLTFSRALVPLLAMTLAVGFFEAVFFRGWLQLRFEAAFGVVPGLLLAALCYSVYHVGYGMGVQEMLFLFGLGLTFGAFFRLTKNVFVLWPFYTPVGSLYTNLGEGLTMPFEATYGFLLTIGLMVTMIVVAKKLQTRNPTNEGNR